MAWTTPQTWVSQVLTSDDMNTYIRDNQEYLKSRIDSDADNYVRVTGNYTTTSTTPTDIDATNLSHTITTVGGDVLVTFTGYCTNTSNATNGFHVDVDGTTYTLTQMRKANGGDLAPLNTSYVFTGLSAGSHTFTAQYSIASGTLTLYAGTLQFDVREIGGLI